MDHTTESGKVLTDTDIDVLADEAEDGYDVEHLVGAPVRRTTRYTEIMEVRMCPDELAEVVAAAELELTSVSAWVREAIRTKLANPS